MAALTSLSHGAGCGCKLPAAALRPLLAGLPHPSDPLVLVGLVEPAALGQRRVEHPLQRRRRVGDDLLRVGEALGVAERVDGGVDLFR